MSKGNADVHGGVEAGDQLAAINGGSSIGMKVDDICAAISEASARARVFELTFLRYVGPCRPLVAVGRNVEEEEFSDSPQNTEFASSEDHRPNAGQSEGVVSSGFPEENPPRTSSTKRASEAHVDNNKAKASTQKRGFGMKKLRLFGRGKKSSKSE